MLFALPFIAVAMAIVRDIMQGGSVVGEMTQGPGVINLSFLSDMGNSVMIAVNVAVILGMAYMLFYINERNKVLAQTTTLPSLIYVMLTSALVGYVHLSGLLFAVVFVVIAVNRLQIAINNPKVESPIFDFGFCICIAVLLSPKLILLVLWAICVLLFSGRSTLKDIMALLFGIVVPVLLLVFYYFWIDCLPELPSRFVESVFAGQFLRDMPYNEWARLGVWGLLLLVSLYNVMNYYPISVVNQRRGILSMVSLFLFLGMTVCVIPGNSYDFIYVLALPLAFIYSQYFVIHRIRILANILFLLFVLSCFLWINIL